MNDEAFELEMFRAVYPPQRAQHDKARVSNDYA